MNKELSEAEAALNKQEQMEKEQCDEAVLVSMTVSTPGWKILERDFVGMGKQLTTDLIEAHDIEDVHRIQAQVKAIDKLLGIVLGHYEIALTSQKRG